MNGRDLRAQLKQGVILLDGGMGTTLMREGLALGRPGELWNLENPDAIRAVHNAYFQAGCDAVQTNTFGGSRLRLESHGLADQFEAINQAAARLAREAAGEDRLVGGNLGPSGLFLPPVGMLEPAALIDSFMEQTAVLAESGVDYISIETKMDLKAACLALEGAHRGAPNLPISVTLVFEKKKRGFFTPMGDRPEEVMATLAGEGADLAGANCSMGSNEMKELTDLLVKSEQLPIVMKPNAGLPETVGSEVIYRQQPEEFADDLLAMVEKGVRAVGGCCGTDEKFIACLEAGLRERGFRTRSEP